MLVAVGSIVAVAFYLLIRKQVDRWQEEGNLLSGQQGRIHGSLGIAHSAMRSFLFLEMKGAAIMFSVVNIYDDHSSPSYLSLL